MPGIGVTPNDIVLNSRWEPKRHGTEHSAFVYVVCQHGTEGWVKSRLMADESPLKLAFSRPGLLTFKFRELASSDNPAAKSPAKVGMGSQVPNGILIRHSGVAIGQLRGDAADTLVAQALDLAGREWDAVHVFARDVAMPGANGFEPGANELTNEVTRMFGKALPGVDCSGQPSPIGSRVLNILLVEPNQWLVGYHTATSPELQWPGGSFPLVPPEPMISRAYLKIAEALAWSEFPTRHGERFLEIGSAPGGACQRLLDLGFEVVGVDPAEMDSLLSGHPRFEHWQNKSSAIKRKRYSKFRWLAADANVAPSYTLDAVEDIVNYPTSRFSGLILTMKLTNFELVEQFNAYADRVRGWGFSRVKARQLSFNRRECCLVASR
ncbi:MAG: SAM-dependent methyltransferase [Aureliella sp.]